MGEYCGQCHEKPSTPWISFLELILFSPNVRWLSRFHDGLIGNFSNFYAFALQCLGFDLRSATCCQPLDDALERHARADAGR